MKMSRERQLLKEALKVLEWNGIMGSHDTYNSIKELLSQPEQEPVAWMYDHHIEVGYDKYTEFNIVETCARNLESENCINVRPLYLAPPKLEPIEVFEKFLKDKREPLSDEEIADLWSDTNSVRNFARAIEKAHGIGE